MSCRGAVLVGAPCFVGGTSSCGLCGLGRARVRYLASEVTGRPWCMVVVE